MNCSGRRFSDYGPCYADFGLEDLATSTEDNLLGGCQTTKISCSYKLPSAPEQITPADIVSVLCDCTNIPKIEDHHYVHSQGLFEHSVNPLWISLKSSLVSRPSLYPPSQDTALVPNIYNARGKCGNRDTPELSTGHRNHSQCQVESRYISGTPTPSILLYHSPSLSFSACLSAAMAIALVREVAVGSSLASLDSDEGS